MVLCFIVFPYYRKEAPAEPQPAPPQPVEPQPVAATVPGISVAMHWEVKKRDSGWSSTCYDDDVDLYVDAPGPDGRRLEYSFKKKTHSGSPAVYLVDATRGGGEVWVHPKATPGIYRVGFKIYNVRSNRSQFSGYRVMLTVVTPDGTRSSKDNTGAFRPFEFSPDRFVSGEKKYNMLEIEVKADGGIVFHEPRGNR